MSVTNAIPEGQIVTVREEWFDGEGVIFLIWGILNLNGPTLYCLGQKRVNGKWRIFFRWLHMLGGCTTYATNAVDAVTYQDLYEGAESIHQHLFQKEELGLFHVIPSFLIANRGDEVLAPIAKRLLSNGAAASADWGRHMAYVRRFGSDLLGRAGAEIRQYYESGMAEARAMGREPSELIKSIELGYGHLPEFRDAEIPTSPPSPITPALLDEWWSAITTREFCESAIHTLHFMWSGALSELLPDDMKRDAVPFDRITDLLVRYNFEAWSD